MEVLRIAILDMLRRKKGKSFLSCEVVQQMFPEDWEQFLADVNAEVVVMSQEGLIKTDFHPHKMSMTDFLRIHPPSKL